MYNCNDALAKISPVALYFWTDDIINSISNEFIVC